MSSAASSTIVLTPSTEAASGSSTATTVPPAAISAHGVGQVALALVVLGPTRASASSRAAARKQ